MTGQNYDKNLNDVFFKDLKLRKPDFKCILKNKSLFQNISEIFDLCRKKLFHLIQIVFLFLVILIVVSSALVAKKFKIPIFHLESWE